MPDSRILLGVIGRPHGVRGLVRVTSYADDLTAYGPLSDAKGRQFVLRWRGEGVAEIAERVGDAEVKVADRSTAEKLTNTRLFIERARLPQPDADEFYLADLIGLVAFDGDGAKLGTVTVVHDYGAGVSLEIERDNAPPVLVPFTHACVPEVNIAAASCTVHLAHEVGEVADPGLAPGDAGEGAAHEAPSPVSLRSATSPAQRERCTP